VKDVVEGYLKEHIDTDITIKQWNEREYLPIFLSEIYSFYKMNILGEYCLLIEVNNEIPGIENLKKHMNTISKNIDDELVLLFKSISSFRRKTLIENRIPFIVENGQMYLPFLGMKLKKTTDKNTKIIEKFSSSAQLVFLYFLYNKDLQINTTELAEIFNTAKMTASRALNDLYLLGLLTYEISGKTGRSKRYKRIDDTCYYNRGSKYLKNPVNKVKYVDNNIAHDFPVAGLEALSMQSMLNPPKNLVRAISKQKAKDIKEQIILNRDKIADMNLIELQIWNYEPEFLAVNGVVDLVSLVMSVSETNDDRVDIAIEERLKCEIWYTV
jgi:predicted transcriptional regulator